MASVIQESPSEYPEGVDRMYLWCKDNKIEEKVVDGSRIHPVIPLGGVKCLPMRL